LQVALLPYHGQLDMRNPKI